MAHFHLPRVLFQENCTIGKKCQLKYSYYGGISLGSWWRRLSYEEIGDTRRLAKVYKSQGFWSRIGYL